MRATTVKKSLLAAAVVCSVAPTITGTPAVGTPAAVERRAHPGPGYVFKDTGACRGVWASTDDGSCTHADPPSSPFDADDPVELFDPGYTLDLTSETSSYCNNSSVAKVRIIYANIQGTTSRYTDLAATLRSKAEYVDYYIWKSAQEQGYSRHVRFVCTSGGSILVDNLTLPTTADDSFSALKSALAAKGYSNSYRKYLVFGDWPEATGEYCGFGDMYEHDIAGQSNSNNTGYAMYGVVYLKPSSCGSWAKNALHELGHMLGSTQRSAPRHDSANPLHPRDQYDVMAYGTNTYISSTCNDTAKARRYDCNKNDYFDARPPALRGTYLATHWDIADSRYLVGSGYL